MITFHGLRIDLGRFCSKSELVALDEREVPEALGKISVLFGAFQ